MPVTYTLDARTRLVRTLCVGNVTLAEVLALLREFQKDTNSSGRVDVLLDLTETTSLPSGFQITAVADELRRVHATVRFNACAVVAQRDALFGMMRMFQVMAEPYFRAIRVFRNYLEAETWLTSESLPAVVPAAITTEFGWKEPTKADGVALVSNVEAPSAADDPGRDLESGVNKLSE